MSTSLFAEIKLHCLTCEGLAKEQPFNEVFSKELDAIHAAGDHIELGRPEYEEPNLDHVVEFRVRKIMKHNGDGV